jgi:cyclic pyranopterin phosphate synthase
MTGESDFCTCEARSKRSASQLPLPFMFANANSLGLRAIHTSSRRPSKKLTHFDVDSGRPSMVSVSEKDSTLRRAKAVGTVHLSKDTFNLLQDAKLNKKGDPLTVAQLAGIMGAKHTSLLIPLCHPLSITHIDVKLHPEALKHSIAVEATVETRGQTGVEMEALTAVSVACLTVWDMVKAAGQQEMRISDIHVVSKSGGKSGDWSLEHSSSS